MSDVRKWNVTRVCAHLRDEGMPDRVIEVFESNEVDGATLLHITKQDLKQELEISKLADRKHAWAVVSELQKATAAAADVLADDTPPSPPAIVAPPPPPPPAHPAPPAPPRDASEVASPKTPAVAAPKTPAPTAMELPPPAQSPTRFAESTGGSVSPAAPSAPPLPEVATPIRVSPRAGVETTAPTAAPSPRAARTAAQAKHATHRAAEGPLAPTPPREETRATATPVAAVRSSSPGPHVREVPRWEWGDPLLLGLRGDGPDAPGPVILDKREGTPATLTHTDHAQAYSNYASAEVDAGGDAGGGVDMDASMGGQSLSGRYGGTYDVDDAGAGGAHGARGCGPVPAASSPHASYGGGGSGVPADASPVSQSSQQSSTRVHHRFRDLKSKADVDPVHTLDVEAVGSGGSSQRWNSSPQPRRQSIQELCREQQQQQHYHPTGTPHRTHGGMSSTGYRSPEARGTTTTPTPTRAPAPFSPSSTQKIDSDARQGMSSAGGAGASDGRRGSGGIDYQAMISKQMDLKNRTDHNYERHQELMKELEDAGLLAEGLKGGPGTGTSTGKPRTGGSKGRRSSSRGARTPQPERRRSWDGTAQDGFNSTAQVAAEAMQGYSRGGESMEGGGGGGGTGIAALLHEQQEANARSAENFVRHQQMMRSLDEQGVLGPKLSHVARTDGELVGAAQPPARAPTPPRSKSVDYAAALAQQRELNARAHENYDKQKKLMAELDDAGYLGPGLQPRGRS